MPERTRHSFAPSAPPRVGASYLLRAANACSQRQLTSPAIDKPSYSSEPDFMSKNPFRKHGKKLILVTLVLMAAFAYQWMGWNKRFQAEEMLSSADLTSEAKEVVPLSLNCENAQRGTLKFDGTAIAAKNASPAAPEAIVRSQLKYLYGLFHFSEIQGVRVTTFASPKISIQNVRDAKYPATIVLDDGKKIEKGSRATEVMYSAEVPVALCSQNEAARKFALTLPRDPNVAFWYVPKSEHRELQYGAIKHTTNPCAFNQMADLKSPDMYWYVWQPNAEGEGFKCKDFLDPNTEVIQASADFIPAPTSEVAYSFDALGEGPIKISMIFGLLGKKPRKETIQNFASMVNVASSTSFLSSKGIDGGALIALHVLSLMPELANIDEWQKTAEETFAVLKTSGELRSSGRKVEIEVFVGPTVDYHEGTRHWNFLANAVKNSHFIFYNGHAGMGSTFTLEKLKAQTQFSASAGELPQYQMFAVLSCFATDYYGRDFVEFRSAPNQTTDLFLAGFEGHSFMAIPAILQYVDLKLAKQNPSLKKSFARFFGDGALMHLDRYVATAGAQ